MQAGCALEDVNVVSPATIRTVVAAVTARHPALEPLLKSVRWARNHTIVELDEPVREGDEVALLPPVAGGAARSSIVETPIDIGRAIDAVRSSTAGAVVTFLGTVRDHAGGRSVRQITYEVYEPMASRELDRVAADCEASFPDARIHVVHRYGVLAVGEVAVVIAVASPHRESAFAACRAMLERIKTDVPIWKNELGEDGESWVGWGAG
ncbi:MAG: molybdenum cofactor biosynthesis protein MoaE [Myxococcota bacterium]